MIRVVADTHALIWAILEDKRLSPAAREALSVTSAHQVAISSITLAELLYLEEKGRIRAETTRRVLAAVESPSGALLEIPLDRAIVAAMRKIPRHDVPDLPDRIIAATALHLGVPLVTRDRRIHASGLRAIW